LRRYVETHTSYQSHNLHITGASWNNHRRYYDTIAWIPQSRAIKPFREFHSQLRCFLVSPQRLHVTQQHKYPISYIQNNQWSDWLWLSKQAEDTLLPTASGAHPASCTIHTGTHSFLWGKAIGQWRWPLSCIYLRGLERMEFTSTVPRVFTARCISTGTTFCNWYVPRSCPSWIHTFTIFLTVNYKKN
jgi:hypothetical protein